MNLKEIFVCNLKRIRKEKKLSQEKLAEKCSSETSYIGQIESGRRFPSIQFIEKISEALDIKAYLLFKEPEPEFNVPNIPSSLIREKENNYGRLSEHALLEIYEIIKQDKESHKEEI